VRTDVLIGDAPAAIEEHRRRRGARWLVLGGTERSTVQRWMLGSVAERTIRRAECPVVIVPPTVAGAGWPEGRAARAVVALEGNDAGDLLEVVSEVRRGGPCDVTVLHLYWPPEEYARLGLRGPRDLTVPDADIIRDVEPRLRALTGRLSGAGAVNFRIQPAWGEPASSIAMAVEREPCELLIVGAHQRHGLARVLNPPVAEHVLRQGLQVPVVCVPTKAKAGLGAKAAMPPGGRIASVLAPTDLSEHGNAAVAHAYGLLRAGGGVVELIHVQERALPAPAFAYESPRHMTEAERTAIEQQLRALVPDDAAAHGITTHVSVIDGGRPAESIVQAAERFRVDAISLGSQGRGGVGRAVLGSVSDEVVRRAHVPVLVVR
jgi:nucleotide-binding universal stress UspA family protein